MMHLYITIMGDFYKGHSLKKWNWKCGYSINKSYSKPVIRNLSSVQLLSRVWLFATPWTAAHQASMSITKYGSLLKVMSIGSMRPSNHLILCRPLLFPPSVFPSIRVFSNESVLRIRWPKYWSFSICPSNEYSGLISFKMDWLALPVVQGTLKSLLQHHRKSINSLALSVLYSPTLTSMHDYWKNDIFDYMDLCCQSNVSVF